MAGHSLVSGGFMQMTCGCDELVYNLETIPRHRLTAKQDA